MELQKVYGLYDPRTDELRYIGKTHGKLNDRLSSHIYESREHKHKRACWIRSLTKLSLRPVIKLIQETEDCLVDLLEIHYIEYYKSIGCKLTNMQPGGDGQPKGYEFKKRFKWGKNDPRNDAKHLKSPENIAKQKEAMKAFRGVKRKYVPKPILYKKMFLFCLKTRIVLEFESGQEAAKYLNVRQSNLTTAAKVRNRKVKHYYVGNSKEEAIDNSKLENVPAQGKKQPLKLVREDGTVLEFAHILEAVKSLVLTRKIVMYYLGNGKFCKYVKGRFYVNYKTQS